jgi:hypothetical protein
MRSTKSGGQKHTMGHIGISNVYAWLLQSEALGRLISCKLLSSASVRMYNEEVCVRPAFPGLPTHAKDNRRERNGNTKRRQKPGK